MTTKDYLYQIQKYEKLIVNKMNDIGKLRNLAASTSVHVKEVDVQVSSDKDKLGCFVSKIVDMEREVDSLIDKRWDIIRQIEDIKNIDQYEVLVQVYVKGKGIEETELTKTRSSRQIRRIHDKAVREFEKKFGETYLNA